MGDPLAELTAGGAGSILKDQLSSPDKLQKQYLPDTPEQRREAFLKNFYASFGGNPNVPGGGVGNQNYINSLRGYYNNAPFQDIANKFAQVNTFLPRAKPQNYRFVKGGGDSGPFIPTGVMGLF